MSRRDGERLGAALVRQGLLSPDQLALALREQRQQAQPLGAILCHLGFLNEGRLSEALAAQLGLPYCAVSDAIVPVEALQQVDHALARRWKVLPLQWDSSASCLTLAAARPDDLLMQDAVLSVLPAGSLLSLCLAPEGALESAIERAYGSAHSLQTLLDALEAAENGLAAEGLAIHPVVALVDGLLRDAVMQGASDIHFEPEAAYGRIRYRLHGLLQDIHVMHRKQWPSLIVRLKVMAGLDIAEHRAPQDGRLSLTVCGRRIDCRVAVLPTLHGENLVVRILDRERGILSLEALGLSPVQCTQLRQLVARPEGILLITGPTGAGKTTTLYALLQELDARTLNIMTLEDPVEYPFPGLRQTSISDAIKLDFADGVRAILRQDPDVILIGEIRDEATATMAWRAAMTGHLVLSTLHSRSALGAIPRLKELGIPAAQLAGQINGLMAQRLIRQLCPHCRQARTPSAEERALWAPQPAPDRLYEPKGCEACQGRGYQGRRALMEVLLLSPALNDALEAEAPGSVLAGIARQEGFIPLAEAGLAQVARGDTSLAEWRRVVG